jgi:DNA-binding transcriptional LysR family regulator
MAQAHYHKDIQLPQLRSFCAAATEGNFTAAAESMNLSVSAVWQQVRTLEQQLGATLLRRRGRSVELTAEGRLLLELLQPYIHGLDSLVRVFQERRKELPQHVTVAATEYLLTYNLPEVVEEFAASHSSVRLNLRGDQPRAVGKLVEQGEADLGVMSYLRDEPRSTGLEYQDLFERQFTLLTAARHPLARKKRIRPEDLLAYPMIAPPRGSFSHRMLDRLLQRHGLADRVHILMESKTVNVVCHYAAMGLGIALLYIGPEICRFLPELRLRPFDPLPETLPIALVVRKGARLTEAAQDFRRTVARLLGNGH